MTTLDLEGARSRLAGISHALDEGSYRKGTWQRFLDDAEVLEGVDRAAISADLTNVSRKLHQLNRFPQIPFAIALVFEIVVLGTGLWLMWFGSLFSVLGGVAALALTLQPMIKVIAGLMMGVRYDYSYLWQVEPRFKMRYGTYFQLTPLRRVCFHLAGSLGTPLAMFIGFVRFIPLNPEMAWVCLVFAVGAALMQVAAFIAEWMGIKRVAGHRLSNLTSPATAAFELKRYLG